MFFNTADIYIAIISEKMRRMDEEQDVFEQSTLNQLDFELFQLLLLNILKISIISFGTFWKRNWLSIAS